MDTLRLKRLLTLSVIALAAILSITYAVPNAQAAVGGQIHQFTPPVESASVICSVGLAADGTALYYNRCGDENIYTIDPISGALEATFDTNIPEKPNAMAYDATRNGLWIGTQGCSATGMPIYFWDFDDNSVVLAFTIPYALINPATGTPFLFHCFDDGLAFNANDPGDPADDEIWFSDDVNPNIGVFNTSGTLLVGYDATTIDASLSLNSGLAIGGDNLYLGNNGGGDIFRADRAAFTLVDQFVSGDGRQEDMECDPVTFAPIEVMWVRTTPQGVAADDLITAYEIEPGTCGLGGGAAGCPDGVISPAEVEGILFPGESLVVEKCVETPVIPPKPDVYFLADTTGSMGPALAAVQADSAAILASVRAAAADAQFGVGSYDDFPFDPPPIFANQQAITPTDANTLLAIGNWAPLNGFDFPESQLYALETIATDPAIGFRLDSARIVVWFGDCPGHDPVPTAATGLGADVTEATATAALVAANIKVVAISTTTACAGGLDGNPLVGNGDYALAYGTVEGGTVGQASRIAAATGGVHLSGVGPDDVSAAILSGLAALDVEVTMESSCTFPITTTFEPASQIVESGNTATFTETITVAANAPGGTYICRDVARIDGELLIDPATGDVAYETKTIRVPEGFLTGGGQILTTKGKQGLQIGQSGNVGFLADFSLIGNWNVQLHNVGPAALDGAHFKSTEITFLQFHKDAGAGPNPPPANANVGAFAADGTLNGVAGYNIQVCLADRGEPGKLDSIRIKLFNPADVLIYDSSTEFPSEDNTVGGFCANRHKLDHGNYQIHSGLKQ